MQGTDCSESPSLPQTVLTPPVLCGCSHMYLGYAVAGVEEDGRVGVHEAFFEGEEPLNHIIPVVTGEAFGGRMESGAGQALPQPPRPRLPLLPPAPLPSQGSPS